VTQNSKPDPSKLLPLTNHAFPQISVLFESNHHTLLLEQLPLLFKQVSEDAIQWPAISQRRIIPAKAGFSQNEVERAAHIYRSAIDEMRGNSFYEWHHHPDMI